MKKITMLTAVAVCGFGLTGYASLRVDFGPGALQTGFTGQSNTDITYADVVYTTVDVNVDASTVGAGFSRAPDVDPVVSSGATAIADGININNLEDDLLFASAAGAGVDVTIEALATGDEVRFEIWLADTRTGGGAGVPVDQEVFIDGTSMGVFSAQLLSPAPTASFDLTGTGADIVVRVQEANSYGQLRYNGFAITAIPEPATLGMVAVFGGGILFIRRRFMI